MEKYVEWYRLLIKLSLKRKSTYIQLLLIVLCAILLMQVNPHKSNKVYVGIMDGSEEKAELLLEQLVENNSAIDFIVYLNEARMLEDVSEGRLECAFSIDGNLEKQFKANNIYHAIHYYATPFTTMGEIAKETLFAHLFRCFSSEVLKIGNAVIYNDNSDKQLALLLEKNKYYLESKETFQLLFKEVEMVSNDNSSNSAKILWLQGFIGIFVFFSIYLSFGRRFEYNGKNVWKALNRKDKFAYGIISNVASGSIPAIGGLSIILISSQTRGYLKEVVLMIVFVVASSIWIEIFGRALGNASSFVAQMLTLFITQLFLCPILFDSSIYFRALRLISYLFPLGIYTRL